MYEQETNHQAGLWRYMNPVEICIAGIVGDAVTGTEKPKLRADPLAFNGLEPACFAECRPIFGIAENAEPASFEPHPELDRTAG